jgi:hypothetical protein
MRSLMLPLSAALLAACAAHAPLSAGKDKWTYIGNDPDGTQNISMRLQGTDKKQDRVTSLFRFEFIAPRQLTGPDLKTVKYIERRDLVEVDCGAQTLRLLDETYFDVEGRQVFHVSPGAGADPNQVFAGGVSDMLYEASCGKSISWTDLGQDPQKTQEIYARVGNAGGQHDAIMKANFRFVYRDPRKMVAAPSLNTVEYLSRQASVMMDCGNQTFNLLHETYYDADGVAVFGVTPAKDAHPDSVVPGSVTGMMYKAACAIPLDWTYLGTDPRNTQKIYLLGAPQSRSGNNVEARFRFEYLAPGKLTTGADLKQIEYTVRTSDVLMDCSAKSLVLLREAYLDASGKEVFSIRPANPAPAPVAPQGPSGIMQKAVCH